MHLNRDWNADTDHIVDRAGTRTRLLASDETATAHACNIARDARATETSSS